MKSFKRLDLVLVILIFILSIFNSISSAQSNNKSQAPSLMPSSGDGTGGGTELPDLFTGAMSQVIPIEVPPGRKGMDPGLALTYNSQNGNGLAGVGWDLEVGAIERSTKQGVNYSDGDSYVFSISGSAGDLVRTSGTPPGDGEFRAKIEGAFTRFKKIGSYWEARDKTGTRYLFGQINATRQYNPSDSNQIFKWALDRVVDRNGNYMVFTYTKATGQIYLDRIDYTGNEVTGLGTTNYVKFYYEDRPDAPEMYTSNFSVKTAKRLKTIDVSTTAGRVRAYNFTYPSTTSASTGRSLLEKVRQYGKNVELDGNGDIINPSTASALPPTTFSYSTDPFYQSFTGGGTWKSLWCAGSRSLFGTGDFDGNGTLDIWCHQRALGNSMTEGHWATSAVAPSWGGAAFSWAGDFNGDRLTDIATADGGNIWVSLSTGSGFLQQQHWTSSAHWGDSKNTLVGDFNGDGLTDIVSLCGGKFWMKRSTGASFEEEDWGVQGSWGSDGFGWVGDFNGDGLSDLATRIGESMWVKLSTGTKFVGTGTGFVEEQWATDASHWDSSSTRTWAADFNGDGLTDIAVHDRTTDKMWLKRSTGTAFEEEDWGAVTDHEEGTGFRWVGDFNGDGLLDIAVANGGNIWVRLSSGSHFYEESWLTTANWDGPENAWAADFNGDGLTDIATYVSGRMWLKRSTGSGFVQVDHWADDVDTWEGSGYRWVGDFNGDGFPDIAIRNSGIWVKRSTAGSTGGPLVALSNAAVFTGGGGWLPNWCGAAGKTFGTGDFNADGKSDVFCHDTLPASSTKGDIWVALSDGASAFTGGTVPWKNDWCMEAGMTLGTGDFNGDGRTDLVCHSPQNNTPGSTQIALSNGEDAFTGGSEWRSDWCGHSGAMFGTGDFNGDGKTDIFCRDIIPTSGGNTWIALSNGSNTFFDVTPNGDPWRSNWCKQPGTRYGTGDFNGDGKTDIFCHETSAKSTSPNPTTSTWVGLSNGAGQLNDGNASGNSWGLNFCKEVGNMLGTGDFNGDGKTDFFCHSPQNHTPGNNNPGLTKVMLSNGSALFNGNERSNWCGEAGKMFGIGDFTGDGKTDLFCHDLLADSFGETRIARSGSLNWSTDLLTSISTGTGGATTIVYTSSTIFTNTRLPFPVQVVSTVTTSDGTNSSFTSYFYQNGFYYLQERDFRGFEFVKVTGPAGPDGERSIAETWFHQGNGAVGNPAVDPDVLVGHMKGKPYHTRIINGQGGVMSETFTTYVADSVEPHFNPPQQVDSYTCDGDACGIHLQSSYAYDANGNVTVEDLFGDFTNRRIVRSFSNNTTDWIVGLPLQEDFYRGNSTVEEEKVASTTFYYDGVNDCNTMETNQSPVKGNLTRIKRWLRDGVDPNTLMAYDSYGNLTCTRDARGNATTISYDSLFTFPKVTTNALGHQTTIQYYGVDGIPADTAATGLYGQVKTVSSPNGAVSTTEYDPLGRKVKVTAPGADGTPNGNITTWSYNNIGTLNLQHIQTTSVATGLSSWSYFDGLGRTTLEKKSGPNGQIIITETRYNVTGTVKQTSLPYFEGGSPLWRTFVYDAVGRVTQATNPDGSRILSCYNDGVSVSIDASNHRKREVRDGNGRLVRVDEYTGTFSSCTTEAGTPYATTLYQYDVLGNLRFVTDAKQNETEMRYDTLGRKIFMHDPDMGNWSYQYDAVGNLITQINARGIRLQFTYDSLNRVKTKTKDALDEIAPTPPSNLVAVTINTAQINLTWTASTDNIGITGYRLERCQGENCTNFSQIAISTGTSFNDTGLAAGITYRYQVRAEDAPGNLSPYSNIASATTDTSDTKPPTISDVVSINITLNGATINWTTDEASDSQVEFGTTTAYGNSSPLNTAVASSHSVILSNLSPFTLYRYRVKSRDPAGNLAASQDFIFTTQALPLMIAAGSKHSCARLSNGTVSCWGNNGAGQLGNGTTANSLTPVAVSGITSATAIAAGGAHSCAVLSNGTISCWGGNASGQLGNGTITNSLTPVTVSGITTATAVAARDHYTCALLSNGTVNCWGLNHVGQLGNGTTTNSSTPITVSGITTATAVASGDFHACAILSDGTVKCWGYGFDGQLGDGAWTSSLTPVTVSGITTARYVSLGYFHSCAALSNGTVNCWGLNHMGQLGNGTTTGSSTPVAVSEITTATAIAAGVQHTCALLSNGTVNCWGNNGAGQLGNGTTTDSLTPVAVTGMTTAVAIAAGDQHNCAWLSNFTINCWGLNNFGQLGNGTTNNSSTPVAVSGFAEHIPPTVPLNLSATVASGGQVAVVWGTATDNVGVHHYELERRFNNNSFTLITSPSTVNFTDSATSANTAYLYRVRAVDAAGNVSGYSNIDLATTVPFTDNPLVVGTTTIKAQHLTELRQAVNAVRLTAGLAASVWTDPTLAGLFIQKIHIEELRSNLTPALTALGFTAPTYTDPTLTAGSTVMKKAHVEELRQGVK